MYAVSHCPAQCRLMALRTAFCSRTEPADIWRRSTPLLTGIYSFGSSCLKCSSIIVFFQLESKVWNNSRVITGADGPLACMRSMRLVVPPPPPPPRILPVSIRSVGSIHAGGNTLPDGFSYMQRWAFFNDHVKALLVIPTRPGARRHWRDLSSSVT